MNLAFDHTHTYGGGTGEVMNLGSHGQGEQ